MPCRSSTWISAFALLHALTVAAPVEAEVRFRVTPLGPITPTGVNEHGQVIGFSGSQAAERQVWLWLPSAAYGLNAGLNDLGRPAFAAPGNGVFVDAINNLGQVVGDVSEVAEPYYTATLWLPSEAYGHPAGWSRVDERLGPATSTTGAINNSGQVVGRGGGRAYQWLPTAAYGMPAGPHYFDGFAAAGINEAGQVVGAVTDAGGGAAYLYLPEAAYGREAGQYHIEVPHGGPGFFNSFGDDINSRGQVVGSWMNSDLQGRNTSGTFLWLPEDDPLHGLSAGLTNLPVGGLRLRINDAGLVLAADSVWDAATHAMTRLQDLIDPASGLEIISAVDLNNAGQIVGRGRIDGQEQGFLLTVVPEPASVSMLALATLAGLRRKRTAVVFDVMAGPEGCSRQPRG